MLTDSSRIYTLKPLHTLVWTLRNILLKQQFSDFSTEIYPWRSSDLSMIQSTVFVVCWCGTSLLFFCLRRKNCLNVTRTLFKKTLFSFWKYHQQSPFLASGAHWCLFVKRCLGIFSSLHFQLPDFVSRPTALWHRRQTQYLTSTAPLNLLIFWLPSSSFVFSLSTFSAFHRSNAS